MKEIKFNIFDLEKMIKYQYEKINKNKISLGLISFDSKRTSLKRQEFIDFQKLFSIGLSK